jgi:hypothetical protein
MLAVANVFQASMELVRHMKILFKEHHADIVLIINLLSGIR